MGKTLKTIKKNAGASKQTVKTLTKIPILLIIIMAVFLIFLAFFIITYAITGDNYLQMFVDWIGGLVS